jgi:hypothetical protein
MSYFKAQKIIKRKVCCLEKIWREEEKDRRMKLQGKSMAFAVIAKLQKKFLLSGVGGEVDNFEISINFDTIYK